MTYTIQLPVPSDIRKKTVSYPYSISPETSVFRTYTILNYTPENTHPSIYRSVVLDADTNAPLAFSPVKSIPFDQFAETYPTITEDIQIAEMVEGTMITLFYDGVVGRWQIATKNAIGGHYWYFNNTLGTSEKTFRKMCYDALSAEYPVELSDIPFIAGLDKRFVYSFVLQHPENHLVFYIDHPKLVLVAIYSIVVAENNAYTVSLIPQREFVDIIPDLYTSIVGVPEYIPNTGGIGIPDLDYTDKKGFVITNVSTGDRTKLDNPEYVKRKELRGNHPHLHFQFLELMRTGKSHEFLAYFPMYAYMYRHFYTQYQSFITDVHQAYVAHFIHRKTDIRIPKKYFVHAARIHHTIYIPSLTTEQKTVIRRPVVSAYFDQMEPREVLFAMYFAE